MKANLLKVILLLIRLVCSEPLFAEHKCVLSITDAKQVPLDESDVNQYPIPARQKWEVITKLENRSSEPVVLLSVPYYSGSVEGKIEFSDFGAGSRLPIKSASDFIVIKANTSISAKHYVYALAPKEGRKWFITGQYFGNLPDAEGPDHKLNNFPKLWYLERNPVGEMFDLWITLFDYIGLPDNELNRILGDNSKYILKGSLISDSVKLRIKN